VADHDLGGFVPGAGAGDVILGRFDGLVHGCIEYQVLMTFSNGAMAAGNLQPSKPGASDRSGNPRATDYRYLSIRPLVLVPYR
jgi:hypothetical protein